MDLSTLEEWADTTWKLKKGEAKPCTLGRTSHGTAWVGCQLAQQVPLDRLGASQLPVPMEMKANYTPGCTGKTKPADQGKGLFPPTQCPWDCLWDSVQERDPDKQTGTSPKKGLPGSQGPGAHHVQESQQELCFSSLEMIKMNLPAACQRLKQVLQGKQILLRGTQQKDKRELTWAAARKILAGSRISQCRWLSLRRGTEKLHNFPGGFQNSAEQSHKASCEQKNVLVALQCSFLINYFVDSISIKPAWMSSLLTSHWF